MPAHTSMHRSRSGSLVRRLARGAALLLTATQISAQTPPDAADQGKLAAQIEKARSDHAKALEMIAALEEQIETQEAVNDFLRKQIKETKAKVEKEEALKKPPTTPRKPEPDPLAIELPTEFLTRVTPQVVVIEGDQSNGTGFICGNDDEAWIYTAAHVLSGNNRIAVRDSKGTVYREFEYIECAEGVDLVRLKPKQANLAGLELISLKDSPMIGDIIVAVGNSLGTGSLSGEPGRVIDVGADMWEVDADIIPGNSGGPIIDFKTGKVVGIVTHLTIHHTDMDSRRGENPDVKRFAARLDKDHTWQRVPVSRLVKEWRHIENMARESSIAWAATTLMYGTVAVQPKETTALARQIIAENRQHTFARRADFWIKRYKSADRQRKNDVMREGNGIVDRILSDIRLGSKEPEVDDFTWYHRQAYKAEREFREALTK